MSEINDNSYRSWMVDQVKKMQHEVIQKGLAQFLTRDVTLEDLEEINTNEFPKIYYGEVYIGRIENKITPPEDPHYKNTLEVTFIPNIEDICPK